MKSLLKTHRNAKKIACGAVVFLTEFRVQHSSQEKEKLIQKERLPGFAVICRTIKLANKNCNTNCLSDNIVRLMFYFCLGILGFVSWLTDARC